MSEDTQLKILSRLESMEDNQADIYNVIDSVWNELISIHDTIKLYTAGRGLTGISKLEQSKRKRRDELRSTEREERKSKEKHFYDNATIGGVKCSEFQKGDIPNTIVVPPPKFINGIEQLITFAERKQVKCTLCENFDKGIKERTTNPLAVCILPDHYNVTGKNAFDLLESQLPHLCDNLHSGTWTIIYDYSLKAVVYYYLPAHKHESKIL